DTATTTPHSLAALLTQAETISTNSNNSPLVSPIPMDTNEHFNE
ncbi:10056_t:CDS:1, partial [Dentiscutata heterogama]